MIIEIEELTFKTIIGILGFERSTPQRVIVNLKAEYNYKDGEFIDYVELCNIIKDTLNINKFELLEDAINAVEQNIKSRYKLNNLYLKIAKPDILKDAVVSLSNRWDYQVS